MSKRCLVSYYPSTDQIYGIYDNIDDARADVKTHNMIQKAIHGELLGIGIRYLTDEECQKYFGKVESEDKE